jgi:hypothetical protein
MVRLVVWLAVLVLSAAPGWADPVSDGAGEIIKQWGAPGAIIVILGAAVLGLAYKLGKTQDARLDDQREFAKRSVGLTNDYKESAHDIAKTTAAQSVAIDGIDAGAKARWVEAKGALDRLGDKIDDKLDPLATGIAANGAAVTGIAADIRDMRNHALGQRGGGGR